MTLIIPESRSRLVYWNADTEFMPKFTRVVLFGTWSRCFVCWCHQRFVLFANIDLSFAVAELEALLAERGLALDYQLFHQTDQVKMFTRRTRRTRHTRQTRKLIHQTDQVKMFTRKTRKTFSPDRPGENISQNRPGEKMSGQTK